MISIGKLASRRVDVAGANSLEADPLREVDALQETQLVSFRVCHVTSVAALLCDFRTSLQFEQGNSALLVVRNLRSYTWSATAEVDPGHVAWTIMSSSAERGSGGMFRLRIGLYPDALMELSGGMGEFYLMDVGEIGEVPVDYTESSSEEISDSLPSWSSIGRVLQMSCTD